MKLTEKQKRFADYYIETGNATESYIRAGYKETGARANSTRLIANDSIRSYIAKRITSKEDDRIAKQDEVLRYLTKVMRREEMENTVVTLRSSRSWYDESGKKNTVEEEKVEIVQIPSRLSDSNKAAELLGKRYTLWTDKLEHSGEVGVIIKNDIPRSKPN